MELTRSEALRLCRQLWRQLGESGNHYKPLWTTGYKNNCPLCEYLHNTLGYDWVGDVGTEQNCIKDCPMVWPTNAEGNHICFGEEGLYTKWRNSECKGNRKAYAKIMAELSRKRIAK